MRKTFLLLLTGILLITCMLPVVHVRAQSVDTKIVVLNTMTNGDCEMPLNILTKKDNPSATGAKFNKANRIPSMNYFLYAEGKFKNNPAMAYDGEQYLLLDESTIPVAGDELKKPLRQYMIGYVDHSGSDATDYTGDIQFRIAVRPLTPDAIVKITLYETAGVPLTKKKAGSSLPGNIHEDDIYNTETAIRYYFYGSEANWSAQVNGPQDKHILAISGQWHVSYLNYGSDYKSAFGKSPVPKFAVDLQMENANKAFVDHMAFFTKWPLDRQSHSMQLLREHFIRILDGYYKNPFQTINPIVADNGYILARFDSETGEMIAGSESKSFGLHNVHEFLLTALTIDEIWTDLTARDFYKERLITTAITLATNNKYPNTVDGTYYEEDSNSPFDPNVFSLPCAVKLIAGEYVPVNSTTSANRMIAFLTGVSDFLDVEGGHQDTVDFLATRVEEIANALVWYGQLKYQNQKSSLNSVAGSHKPWDGAMADALKADGTPVFHPDNTGNENSSTECKIGYKNTYPRFNLITPIALAVSHASHDNVSIEWPWANACLTAAERFRTIEEYPLHKDPTPGPTLPGCAHANKPGYSIYDATPFYLASKFNDFYGYTAKALVKVWQHVPDEYNKDDIEFILFEEFKHLLDPQPPTSGGPVVGGDGDLGQDLLSVALNGVSIGTVLGGDSARMGFPISEIIVAMKDSPESTPLDSSHYDDYRSTLMAIALSQCKGRQSYNGIFSDNADKNWKMLPTDSFQTAGNFFSFLLYALRVNPDQGHKSIVDAMLHTNKDFFGTTHGYKQVDTEFQNPKTMDLMSFRSGDLEWIAKLKNKWNEIFLTVQLTEVGSRIPITKDGEVAATSAVTLKLTGEPNQVVWLLASHELRLTPLTDLLFDEDNGDVFRGDLRVMDIPLDPAAGTFYALDDQGKKEIVIPTIATFVTGQQIYIQAMSFTADDTSLYQRAIVDDVSNRLSITITE